MYILFEVKLKEIGVNQLIALTVINNEGSQKIFEKNGFKMTVSTRKINLKDILKNY